MLPRALKRIKVPRPRTGSIILPRTTNKGEEAEYRHALALYKLTQNPVAAEALFGPDASEGITLINQETGKPIIGLSLIKRIKWINRDIYPVNIWEGEKLR